MTVVNDTRDQFLNTAEMLFAERGFYGVSIASVAGKLGLTKQALLHHFGSKEKLYAEVLKRISKHYALRANENVDPAAKPEENLKSYVSSLYETAQLNRAQTKLLMRELLDNNERAATAGVWYLKPFLIHLIFRVRSIPAWEKATDEEALSLAYQLIGAINYFAISEPTLTGIFGGNCYAELKHLYPKQLDTLIDAALAAGPQN